MTSQKRNNQFNSHLTGSFFSPKSRCELWIIFFSFLFPAINLHAQTVKHELHYDHTNGLSDNFITSICQDNKGFIWITSNYGINRFDGSGFKTYVANEFPLLIRNDYNSSVLDKNGNVLFASYDGVVARYNQKTNDFDNINITKTFGSNYVSVNTLSKGLDSSIYALTTSGIFKLDSSNAEFTDEPIHKNTRDFRVQSIYIDTQKRAWVGVNSGLHVFSNTGTEIAHFEFSESANAESICLQNYNDSVLFIGTANTGLWSVTINSNSPLINTPVQLSSPFEEINCFYKDSKKRVLIGTRSKGLWSINANEPTIKYDSFIPLVTNSKAITCVYEDCNENLWVGTRGTGLICILPFNYSKVVHSSEFGFPSTIVSSFDRDNSGNLWVGSDGDGIFVLSPNYDLTQRFTVSDQLSSSGVLDIAHDRGSFWVATWGGGICRINENTMNVTHWATWNSNIPIDNCKSICISKNKTVWVATNGEGLARFDWENNTWNSKTNGAPTNYSFGSDKWLNEVIEGDDGGVWIATIRSIWFVNEDTARNVLVNSLDKPEHLPLFVHSVAKNNDGDIFAATNKGIYSIDSKTGQATLLDYVPYQEYVSIAFDPKNRCWVTGKNGVFEINSQSKTFQSISVSNSTIPANYFIPRAIYTDSSNFIFVGTTDGFLMFHPDSLGQNNTIQTLEFADIYVGSKKIAPTNLKTGKNLALAYSQAKTIQIEFNIVCPVITQSSYIIEGINDSWVKLGNERKIVLNRLATGSYTIKIKSNITNNVDIYKTISLHLVISPPWWQSWWFIAVSIVLLVAIIAVLTKLRFRQIVLNNEKLEREVSIRTSELKLAYDQITTKNKVLHEKQSMIENKNIELAQTISTKDRLMSILAHDLKNPAFAIVSLLDLLKRNFKSYDENKKLRFIGATYESAITLQNELLKMLEWGRIQENAFAYQPQDSNIISILFDVVAFLKQIAINKSVEIKLHTPSDVFAYVDSQMISIVIRNLLNNAIKFTPRGGIITIVCSQNEQAVSIGINDTGIGMNSDQLENLFQSEEYITTSGTENEKGTGLGLQIVKEFIEQNQGKLFVDSIIGEGTRITMEFPATKANKYTQIATQEKHEAIDNGNQQPDYSLLEGSSILIVDDNSGIRVYLRSILEKYCTISETENGEEGFLSAINNNPDIIISDVDMPNMDGFALSKKIQETVETSHIPLILLTAKINSSDRINGLMSGAIDYITKPFNEQELLVKLNNIIHIKQNIQRNVLIERLKGDDVSARIDPFLEKMLSNIELNYKDAGFCVEKLADMMAVSRSTLIRKAKILIGKNPSEIIVEYRLETAKKLIESGNHNISDIAYDTGFNDPRYFARRFKQYFGQTPTEFRN